MKKQEHQKRICIHCQSRLRPGFNHNLALSLTCIQTEVLVFFFTNKLHDHRSELAKKKITLAFLFEKKKKIKEKCLAELRTDWIQACVSGPVLQAAGLDQVRTLLVDIWNIYHQKYLLLNFENNKSHIPAENYNFRQRS